MRVRILVAVLFVLAVAGAYAVGRWQRLTPSPLATKGAPEIIVALDSTPVPLGSRQLFPIFSHRNGRTFELQVRVTAWGDAYAMNKSPEPESTFDVVVRAPSGKKRFLETRGRLARGAPGVRAMEVVPDAQTIPPMAPSVELLVTFVYEAPAQEAQTLEIDIASVTGRDVTRASAEVRVYELADLPR